MGKILFPAKAKTVVNSELDIRKDKNSDNITDQ